jgi:hypothetical protein
MVMNIEMGGFGTLSQGYNGEIGWSDNPMAGANILDGKMLAQMKAQAAFYSPLGLEEYYPTRETVELSEWVGEPAYKVKMVSADGTEVLQYYSEETSLLLGQEGSQSSPQGDVHVTVEVGEYKDFGGVLAPTVTTLKMGGMEIKNTVDTITWDDVEASSFEPPDSIKALQK